MLIYHIDFFLENAMYGEMHILLYMIVFVSIEEFWLKTFTSKSNDFGSHFFKKHSFFELHRFIFIHVLRLANKKGTI